MPDGNFCMECGFSETYCECHEECQWNDGYYFEAMDRCHTIMVMISELVDGHPAIQKVGVQKNIDKALGHIMHAYQKIGEADFYKDEEEIDTKCTIERAIKNFKIDLRKYLK